MTYYLNQFHCIGNLVAEPEIKDIGKTKVCKFRIAVNNPHNENALYFYVDVWGKEGEKCMMLKKGSQVFISNASVMPKQYKKNLSSGGEVQCTTVTINVDGYCGKVQFGPKKNQDSENQDSKNLDSKTQKNKSDSTEQENSNPTSIFEEEFEF